MSDRSDEEDEALPPREGDKAPSPAASDEKRRTSLLKRRYAIIELLDTERSYIDKLRGAMENYHRPIMGGGVEGVVGGKDIIEIAPIIFGNMEEILQFHKEVFLPALEGSDQSVDQIVDCFLRHKQPFSMYTPYILGRSSAVYWMRQAKEFFESLRRTLGDKIELQSYVIAPVQRFTKYKLLLRDIAKYTRYVGEDAAKAEEAFQLMTTLPQEANDIVCISMIKGLQHDLYGHGQLRHKGAVQFWDSAPSRRPPQDVQVFLFDLRLIITELQDESGFYHYKTDCILTHSVQVIEELEGDPLQWSLVYQDKDEEKYFYFLSSSTANKEEWVQRVKKILQSLEALARGLRIRGMDVSEPKANGTHIPNGLPGRQLSTATNSSLEDLSSSDLDDDRPQGTEYRPLPEKLRKSPKVLKRKDRPLTTTLVPRKFLPLFPECYQVKEECSLAQSHSPQVLRRETFAGEPPLSPGCVQDNKRRATLTPKVLMRSILRVSKGRKHFHKAKRMYSSAERGEWPIQGGQDALVKSPSMFDAARCRSRSDMTVSSSDEDEPVLSPKPSSPRHVMVAGAHYQTTIFIGREDVQEMEAKTHILTAHPGEVFEVRDRSSGSDFWYVRRLHGIVDGQKEEGWVKASHLEPYHAPFVQCEASELYKIQKEVGRGRFGCVKTCLSRQEPAQFVAKIIPKSEMSFAQFAFELNVAHGLRHPNLVRVKEGIEEKANYIIIMERIPGFSLIPTILSRETFFEADAAHYSRQLCAALGYMHRRGLLHLDVRPENVLVHNNRVKLCDFGAARYPDMAAMLAVAKTTLEPEKMYHNAYAPPELFSQGAKTDKTDMWGVGVVTYIMLFGTLPFKGAQAVHTVAKIMDAKPDLNSQLTSDEAQDFIEQLLKRQPRDRLSADDALTSPWLTTRNIYIAAKLDLSKLAELQQLTAAN